MSRVLELDTLRKFDRNIDLDERFERGWRKSLENNWTKDATRAKYGLDENEFVLWLENDEAEKAITFTNAIDNTNTLDVTVKFVAATGISYPANGKTIAVLSQYDNVVKYYEDRDAFELVDDTVESFKFTEDGTEVTAQKSETGWIFN